MIPAHRQEVADEAGQVVVAYVLGQGVEYVQAALRPEVVDPGGVALAGGKPSFPRQPLDHPLHVLAGDAQPFGQLPLSRQGAAGWIGAIQYGLDQVFFHFFCLLGHNAPLVVPVLFLVYPDPLCAEKDRLSIRYSSVSFSGIFPIPPAYVSEASLKEEGYMATSRGFDYASLKEDLSRHLAQQQGTYGICCRELDTGQGFGINDDEFFVQASCLKVAYVLYLYEQVAAGRCALEQRMAYLAGADFSGGSGYLQYIVNDGDRLTLRALAGVAITLSDNIAYRMLKRFLGETNVLRYMEQLGMRHARPNGEQHRLPGTWPAACRGSWISPPGSRGLAPGCWRTCPTRSGTMACHSCSRIRSGGPQGG